MRPLLAPSLFLRALAVVLAVTLVACGGGGGSKAPSPAFDLPDGASTPEAAVKQWLDGISKADKPVATAMLDPDFRILGITLTNYGAKAPTLQTVAATFGSKPVFEGITLKTDLESNQVYARVTVNGSVTANGKKVALQDEVLYMTQKARWFVTSEDDPYWSELIKGPPPTPAWVLAMLDDSPSLPGVYVKPHPGPDGKFNTDDDRVHVNDGFIVPICTAAQIAADTISSPVCYNSNPPTSGPHAAMFQNFRFFATPVPKESLVHSMEHGGVVIWYNTTDATVIKSIEDITNGANGNNRYQVIASPYGGMEPETVALTAWTRLDKFPVAQYDPQRLLTFIQAHSRRFNPEGF